MCCITSKLQVGRDVCKAQKSYKSAQTSSTEPRILTLHIGNRFPIIIARRNFFFTFKNTLKYYNLEEVSKNPILNTSAANNSRK